MPPPPDPDLRAEYELLREEYADLLGTIMDAHSRLSPDVPARAAWADSAAVCLAELLHIDEVLGL
jgi:hypothetical protein